MNIDNQRTHYEKAILGISAYYHDSAAAMLATVNRSCGAGRAVHPQEA